MRNPKVVAEAGKEPLLRPAALARRHLLSLHDLTPSEIEYLLTLAQRVKAAPDHHKHALEGKTLAMLFEKPSLRTHVTFEVGMGQEDEAETHEQVFRPYQVNAQLMRAAGPQALFMHCSPAHRGQEVTDDVMDAPSSLVCDQAENRLHIQKAILLALLS